jgi:hypothetical protein
MVNDVKSGSDLLLVNVEVIWGKNLFLLMLTTLAFLSGLRRFW